MPKLAASKVRQEFSDVLNRVSYGGERIILDRRGKEVAAIISMEDYILLQELENQLDLEAAKKALKEKGSIPWKKLKAELAL